MGSISLSAILSAGLLPENLPAVFNSNGVATGFARFGSAYSITNATAGETVFYNSSKRGGQRRLFGIPHPAFIRDQALFFEKHWGQIEPILSLSPGSASKPLFHEFRPRHVSITPHSELPRIRIQRFSRYKYCLVTDVSRFFHSIYTHTIPWAINGKETSKTDFKYNSAAVFGNRLDFTTRQGQSRQTIGIPIGPDTSKLTSEIIMSAVDQKFLSRSKKTTTYVRHVDDYWIAGDSYEECEKHLQNIRHALRAYELDINEHKTKIISTKYVFSESWPNNFDSQLIDSLGPAGNSDPIDTLSALIARATTDNDDGLIRHAIRVIDEARLWDSDWQILEHFLAQCVVQFPHSLDYVARVVSWRLRTQRRVDKALWTDIASKAALSASIVGRDSEVCWSLWLSKELGQKIARGMSDQMIAHSSPLVLSFLAHCHSHGLTRDRQIRAKLQERVIGDPFAGAVWPLSLELSYLGIADPNWALKRGPDILTALHDGGVSLIDWNAAPKVFESEGDLDASDEDPGYAIEDFGMDYGDGGDSEDDAEESEAPPPKPSETPFTIADWLNVDDEIPL